MDILIYQIFLRINILKISKKLKAIIPKESKIFIKTLLLLKQDLQKLPGLMTIIFFWIKVLI